MCCNVTNSCFSILIAAHNFILSIIDAVINSIRILRSLILWFLLHLDTFVSSIAAISQHCNLRAHSKLINSYFLCSQLYFRNIVATLKFWISTPLIWLPVPLPLTEVARGKMTNWTTVSKTDYQMDPNGGATCLSRGYNSVQGEESKEICI